MTARPADEPVRLAWADRDPAARAEGRAHDGHTVLPAGRADRLARWVRREWPGRFDLTIDPLPPATSAGAPSPTPEAPVTWLALFGFFSSLWGFLSKHRAILATLAVAAALLLLAILSIALPTAHLRAYPVAALVVFGPLVGFATAKTPDAPNRP